MPPVIGHPKQALVICGSEITSLDRRLSCTSFSPIAQKLRDKSGTSTSDLFLQLETKWQQRPETPALIRRIHTSSSHHTPDQCSDSAEESIRPGSKHPLRPRTAPLSRLPPPPEHNGPSLRLGSVQGGTLPQRGESERITSPRFHQQPDRLQKEGGRIQRRLERLEWLCFDDKCNRLDALSCSSTLVSFFTRVQVSCADISPSFSHLMLDNSAGDIK